MPDRVVQITGPNEITIDDLHEAYLLCRLRRLGIGMAKVMETPSLYLALQTTARAMKKKKQQHGKPAP